MLNNVKLSLRITITEFDQEIQDLIDSARLDLIQSGVSPAIVNEEINIDPLIKRAIITYCKAYFGYDNPEAERFIIAYNMLKQHLSLAGDYTET